MISQLPVQVQAKLRSGVAISTYAQCVEELVHNALDAHATCVAVRIDLSMGKVQVIDNGDGMDKEQLAVVAQRYWTSKCHGVSDLVRLKYFGYRGEALASIRNISSLLEIESRPRFSTSTYICALKQDISLPVTECSNQRASVGTTVTVYDLFYGLPVRKKCQNETLEIERIRHRIEALALMHYDISFSLRNDNTGVKILQTHKSNSPLSVFTGLFGSPKARLLCPILGKTKSCKIEGHIGKDGHYNNSLQFIYVNKHLVLKSKIHKLINYYLTKSTIIKKQGTSPTGLNPNSSPPKCPDRYGIYLVNIECPLNEYDITFDPKKTLVEFHDWRSIVKCIEEMILTFLVKENLLIRPNIAGFQGSKDAARIIANASMYDDDDDDNKEPMVTDECPKRSNIDNENEDKRQPEGAIGVKPGQVQYGKAISTADLVNTRRSTTVQRIKANVQGTLVAKEKDAQQSGPCDTTDNSPIPGAILQEASQEELKAGGSQTKLSTVNREGIEAIHEETVEGSNSSKQREDKPQQSHESGRDSDFVLKTPQLSTSKRKQDVNVTWLHSVNNYKKAENVSDECGSKALLGTKNMYKGAKGSRHMKSHVNTSDLYGSKNETKYSSQPQLCCRNDSMHHVNQRQITLSDEDDTETHISSLQLFRERRNSPHVLLSGLRKLRYKYLLQEGDSHKHENNEKHGKKEKPCSEVETKNDLGEIFRKIRHQHGSQTDSGDPLGFLDSTSDQVENSQLSNHNLSRCKSSVQNQEFSSNADEKLQVDRRVGMNNKTAEYQVCCEQDGNERSAGSKKDGWHNDKEMTAKEKNKEKHNINQCTATKRRGDLGTNDVISDKLQRRNSWDNFTFQPVDAIYDDDLDSECQSTSEHEQCQKRNFISSHSMLETATSYISRQPRMVEDMSSFAASTDANTNRESVACSELSQYEDERCMLDRMTIPVSSQESSVGSQESSKTDGQKWYEYYHDNKQPDDHNNIIDTSPVNKQLLSQYSVPNFECDTYGSWKRQDKHRSHCDKNSSFLPLSLEMETVTSNSVISTTSAESVMSTEMIQLPFSKYMDASVSPANCTVNSSVGSMVSPVPHIEADYCNLSPQYCADTPPAPVEVIATIDLEKESPVTDLNGSSSEWTKSVESSPHGQVTDLKESDSKPTDANRPVTHDSVSDSESQNSGCIVENQFSIHVGQGNSNKLGNDISVIRTVIESGAEDQEVIETMVTTEKDENGIITKSPVSIASDTNESVPSSLGFRSTAEPSQGFQKNNLNTELSTQGFDAQETQELSTNKNQDNDITDAGPSTHSSGASSNFAGTSIQSIGSSWVSRISSAGKTVYVNLSSGYSTFDPPFTSTRKSTTGTQQRDHFFLSHDTTPVLPRLNRCGGPTAGGTSRDSPSFLDEMLEEHVEEEQDMDASVKWRDPLETVQSDDDKDDPCKLSNLLNRWENPVGRTDDTKLPTSTSTRPPDGIYIKRSAVFNHTFTKDMLTDLQFLAQVDKKFLACMIHSEKKNQSSGHNLLVFIDQHAAHERIRLEQLVENAYEDAAKTRMKTLAVEQPVEISLTTEEVRLSKAYRAKLMDHGISFANHKENSVKILSVPLCLIPNEEGDEKKGRKSVPSDIVQTLVKELVWILHDTHGVSGTMPKTIMRILSTQACHGAVKFGDPLQREDCTHILHLLGKCSLPFQCAHGRPSTVPITDLLNVHKYQIKECHKFPDLKKLRHVMKRNAESVI